MTDSERDFLRRRSIHYCPRLTWIMVVACGPVSCASLDRGPGPCTVQEDVGHTWASCWSVWLTDEGRRLRHHGRDAQHRKGQVLCGLHGVGRPQSRTPKPKQRSPPNPSKSWRRRSCPHSRSSRRKASSTKPRYSHVIQRTPMHHRAGRPPALFGRCPTEQTCQP